MSMTYHDFPQGSAEWHQHRATHFNASDAPAMMGCSPYQTRTELLTRMKTGISADVDAATQRRFDDGHRFEALARPLAEKIIGEDLYPVTGSQGKMSASFDGLTLDNSTAFEHKTLNDDLRRAFDDIDTIAPEYREDAGWKVLPTMYRIQMEQQMLVSGAERVLFMASKWNGDELVEERHCWYFSDADLRAKIVAGWDQFEKDLAEFVPTAVEAPKPTGRAPETLPALRIEVTGMVTASNLEEFKSQAMSVFQGISRDLQTDEDFANAEATVKWAKGIEDRLASAKESALAQTESIDALFRTIDDISAEARRVRLDLDRLVKARKEAIKSDIVAEGIAALANHVKELNAAMPANYMPQVPADFGGCIKGLKSVDSIRNAVSTELANAKIRASEIANKIHVNIKTLQESGLVVHDAPFLVLKAPDDLSAVIAQRKAAEQARIDAERERIRKEEADRLERERAHAVQVEAQRIAREQAEAVSADRIRESLVAPRSHQEAATRILSDCLPEVNQADDGARLTLGQINERLSPVSITVDGLASLGFEPVERIKASRLYRECDLPAMCKAIASHVMKAAQVETA